MTLLEITIILYLFIGFFLAGHSWNETDEFHIVWRIIISTFYIAILPITLILGWVWKLIVWIFSPLDSIFQISFYLRFYIFNRKFFRNLKPKYLTELYKIIKETRNTNSLKDRIYRHAANKAFAANNFDPNKEYPIEEDDE